MRRYLVPMLAANIAAFASIAISYFAYSKLLSAQQFGAYAAALAVGNLAVLILDGGLKTSIIKHPTDLSREEEVSLLTVMLALAGLLLLLLYFGQSALRHFYPAAGDQTTFISFFAAVFVMTYPWIGLTTASLERSLSYRKLAWIESIGIVLERGAPAIFLTFTQLGLGSFVLGAAIGRVTRIVLLIRLHRIALAFKLPRTSSVRSLLKEGTMFQIGGAASLVRDNLHVIIVGPLFGTLWVGYYAWGLQLCTIASQIFVQMSARVSLSVTAKAADFSGRWPIIARQISLLTAATAPLLGAIVIVAPVVNHYLFTDKWRTALAILPLLCARMIPGIACTPIGTLLLLERGAMRYAMALWAWTVFEFLAAYAATAAIGPHGLAVSYSMTAWLGVLIMVQGFGVHTTRVLLQVFSTIFGRPALWMSGAISAAGLVWIHISGQPLSLGWVACGLVCLVGAYGVEFGMRPLKWGL